MFPTPDPYDPRPVCAREREPIIIIVLFPRPPLLQ